ncbi:type II toxin-antitoxin system RelE/ParE family toxin [Nitrosococcus oceani]|uniref:type II toxin-antitoxin system RelE/ParE family toxin n=1 Tax=Nitrosococcus oceani TaxID=1229 RepID=UPI001E3C9126|nr:type II toxin-antitoxin system RelE/ParE family toxin [Nitrosococcus oceani]
MASILNLLGLWQVARWCCKHPLAALIIPRILPAANITLWDPRARCAVPLRTLARGSSYIPVLLQGELKGFWSIRVNGNWRVTFRFVGIDIELVNYIDYH